MNSIITVMNEDGIKEFVKLLEFTSTKTNKDYILYTDNNNNNKDEKLKIMCSIIIKENDNVKLLDLEDEEDFNECNSAMKLYLNNLKTNL